MKINAMSQITIDVQPCNGLVYVGFFALGDANRMLMSFDMSVEHANLLISQMETGKPFFLKDGFEEWGTLYFVPVGSAIVVTWALMNGKKTKNLLLAHLDDEGSKLFLEQVRRSVKKVVE